MYQKGKDFFVSSYLVKNLFKPSCQGNTVIFSIFLALISRDKQIASHSPKSLVNLEKIDNFSSVPNYNAVIYIYRGED